MTNHEFENPFDVEKVVGVLSSHERSLGDGSYEYSGMRLQTLTKRLGVAYQERFAHRIVRELQKHPNIEGSKRAPLKYVSDAELERRQKAADEKQRSKEEVKAIEDYNWEALQSLVASHEDLESEDGFTPRKSWYKVMYDGRYRLDFRVRKKDIRVKVGPARDSEERKVFRSFTEGHHLHFDSVEGIVEALEAFDTYVQTIMAIESSSVEI